MAVQFYHFTIVIEKEEDGQGYYAYSPNLPGCYSNGRTVEEARRNMREAIQQHIEVLLEKNQPIPQEEKFFFSEGLTIGVPV